jgi:hypothetical protein
LEPRGPTHRYVDPLDRVWTSTAAKIGLRIQRGKEAYASTPGDGALLLGDTGSLDADDCVAQMVFHELCHSLVEGSGSFERRDWGLDNESTRDVPREHACLRVQAFLAQRHGLRRVLAPTTDFRAFYDALPVDPLSPRTEGTVVLAIAGLSRAERPPWAPHLSDALAATRAIAERAAAFPIERDDGLRQDLWSLLDPLPERHPSGLFGSAVVDEDRTCGTCAWRQGARCRQAGGARIRVTLPGCERWEPALDCRDCGACCRAAYDLVELAPRDVVKKRHPELVVLDGAYPQMKRLGDRCIALEGGAQAGKPDGNRAFVPYTCKIYDDRPKSCQEFERNGEHCLIARRWVSLSFGL